MYQLMLRLRIGLTPELMLVSKGHRYLWTGEGVDPKDVRHKKTRKVVFASFL